MATLTPAFATGSAPTGWLPEAVEQLVIQPLIAESVAMQVSTVVRPGAQTHKLRVPIVTDDPAATWVAELDEITHDKADLDEVSSEFFKLAGLTRLSNEAAEDADPSVLKVNGDGLVRDVKRKLDIAYFGALSSPAPSGLESLTPTEVDADSFANLDPFAEAISEAEQRNAVVNTWVTDPATALDLATIKDETGSNRTLLDRREILGIPLLVSPAVTPGTVWGIPKALSVTGMRKGAEMTTDRSRYFEYDAIALRIVTRVAFLFPHEAAIIRISDTTSS